MPKDNDGTYTLAERAELECRLQGSNKFYHVERRDYGGGRFKVVAFSGAIGSTPIPRPQHRDFVAEEIAKSDYAKLVKKKKNQSPPYSEVARADAQTSAGQVAPESAPGDGRIATGVGGHLPKEIDLDDAMNLIALDRFDASIKIDGTKLYLTYRDGEVIGTNKLGYRVAVAADIEAEFRELVAITGNEAGLTLDGELLFGFHAYDLLEERGVGMRDCVYALRKAAFDRLAARYEEARAAGGQSEPSAINFLKKAGTTEEKRALYEYVRTHDGEGLVFNDREQIGSLYKLKLFKEADLIVRPNRQRSVEGFVHHAGALVSLGNANISQARYDDVCERERRGEQVVAEVRYLYLSAPAGEGGEMIQASVKRVRDDKLPAACTSDQLRTTNKRLHLDYGRERVARRQRVA